MTFSTQIRVSLWSNYRFATRSSNCANFRSPNQLVKFISLPKSTSIRAAVIAVSSVGSCVFELYTFASDSRGLLARLCPQQVWMFL